VTADPLPPGDRDTAARTTGAANRFSIQDPRAFDTLKIPPGKHDAALACAGYGKSDVLPKALPSRAWDYRD